MIRLASLSRPLRAISASEGPSFARSIRIALSSCARTGAAPRPFHQVISEPPTRSSSRIAILSMAGTLPKRTGRSLLVGVIDGLTVWYEPPAFEVRVEHGAD